ncbi:hypothetical protein HDU93_004206 [Gonapodya sp. JEL0774]|nr:hypothetical protein HDU93_004206 [Gonapodya sp. JEL0774]
MQLSSITSRTFNLDLTLRSSSGVTPGYLPKPSNDGKPTKLQFSMIDHEEYEGNSSSVHLRGHELYDLTTKLTGIMSYVRAHKTDWGTLSNGVMLDRSEAAAAAAVDGNPQGLHELGEGESSDEEDDDDYEAPSDGASAMRAGPGPTTRSRSSTKGEVLEELSENGSDEEIQSSSEEGESGPEDGSDANGSEDDETAETVESGEEESAASENEYMSEVDELEDP